MEDYLLDRETLGEFIDELMKQRTIPVNNAGELGEFRESQMAALDDHVSQALFRKLNTSQADELTNLLDQETEDPGVFQQFFQKCGIDVEATITDAVKSFSQIFPVGGNNE